MPAPDTQLLREKEKHIHVVKVTGISVSTPAIKCTFQHNQSSLMILTMLHHFCQVALGSQSEKPSELKKNLQGQPIFYFTDEEIEDKGDK